MASGVYFLTKLSFGPGDSLSPLSLTGRCVPPRLPGSPEGRQVRSAGRGLSGLLERERRRPWGARARTQA